MKELKVNENCIGCGMCVAIDPEHFAIINGLSEAQNSDNLESDALQNAMSSCPTAAIEVVEQDANSKNTVA